jgi:hypothetical protein
MLKSSSRGASGRVDSRTSIDRFELVDDADAVLRALERRLGRGMELKRILICSSGMLELQLVRWCDSVLLLMRWHDMLLVGVVIGETYVGLVPV